jgi:hypothetical protein
MIMINDQISYSHRSVLSFIGDDKLGSKPKLRQWSTLVGENCFFPIIKSVMHIHGILLIESTSTIFGCKYR